MYQRALNIPRLLAIMAVIVVSVLILGCPRAEGTNVDSFSSSYDGTSVDKVLLSSALSFDGEPINPSDTFASDTPEIFCSFWLLEDLCCKNVKLKWQYPDGTVIWWQKVGAHVERPENVSLAKPENGFPEGEYIVYIYLEIWEVLSISFTVE
jgi:hypothetical protein